MRSAGRVYEIVDDVDDYKEPELDPKPQQVTDNVRHRHHQAGEIDLAEDVRVLHEGVGGLGDAVGEILPEAGAGQVEQRPRNPVRGDTGDATEHDHVHDDREGGLDHVPHRTQDGLLVLGDDIPFDEQGTQVPVGPQFLEIHRQEVILRLDDKVPFLFCHIDCQ